MPRAKQKPIPGTERKVHKDITKAAETYVEVRDERMELTEVEVDRKAKLVKVMLKHDESEYIDEDAELKVTLTEGDMKCKVTKWKASTPDPDPAANE